jgi:hypothetical protein
VSSLSVMFVVFNSCNLPELRGKLFAEKQHFASSEGNILNVILTDGQTDVLRHKACNKLEVDTLILAWRVEEAIITPAHHALHARSFKLGLE